MAKRLIVLSLALVFLLSSSMTLPGNGEVAHKLHYQGTVHYLQGQHKQAAGLLQRAYDMEPDNFSFALSLGLCLGRLGKSKDAIQVLEKASPIEEDPSYKQKKILQLFFEGMVYAYSGHYHQAIPNYEKSIKLQSLLNEPKILSVMHNAMGYAIMMNQGRGSHGRNNLPPHYHVHERDMKKALSHFEVALEQDADNASALDNYSRLADSLGVEKNRYLISGEENKELRMRNTYRKMPENLAANFDFENYDEILFLLDISGSMVEEKVTCQGATRFEVMRQVVSTIVRNLSPSIDIGLGSIGADCGAEPTLWYPVGRLDKEAMGTKIRFMVPNGTTPLLSRLKRSIELFSDSVDTKKAIFLVSDGANVCNDEGLNICDWALRLRNKITINTLTFLETNLSNTGAFAEYSCLSENTFGGVMYVDNYNCRLERYEFDLVSSCEFTVPEFRKVECWGPAVKSLWGIFDIEG